MADPEFPRRGVPTSKRSELTYYLAKFRRKLHENEENEKIGPRVEARPKFYYEDSPLLMQNLTKTFSVGSFISIDKIIFRELDSIRIFLLGKGLRR